MGPARSGAPADGRSGSREPSRGAVPRGLGDMKFLAPPAVPDGQGPVLRRAWRTWRPWRSWGTGVWLVVVAVGGIGLSVLTAWGLLHVLLAIVLGRPGGH